MAALGDLDLPPASPERLRAAVRRALELQAADVAAPSVGPRSLSGRLPTADKLARASASDDEDSRAARYFLTVLEAAYLVASADGLDADERDALAVLVSHAAGEAMSPDRAAAAFDRFEAALGSEGRSARLAAVAACFTDFVEREEAMSFAALVAIADGRLAPQEARALVELGERFGYSTGEVQAAVGQVAATVRAALAAPAAP